MITNIKEWLYSHKTGIFLVMAMLLASWISCFQLVNEDIGYYVRTGDRILSEGTIFFKDDFTYTANHKMYQPVHWIFYIFASTIYSLGGDFALVVFKMVMAMVFTVFLFLTLKEKGLENSTVFSLCVFTMLLTRERWIARPHLFSYVLFMILTWYLSRIQKISRKTFLLIFFLILLFTNIHPGCVFSLALVGFFALFQLPLFVKNKKASSYKGYILPILLVLVAILAFLITPITPKHITYLFGCVTIHAELGLPEEAHAWPPLTRPDYWIFLFSWLFLMTLDRWRAKKWHIFSAFVFFAAGFWAIRLIFYAVIASLITFPVKIKFSRKVSQWKPLCQKLFLLLVLSLSISWPLWFTLGGAFRLGFTWNQRKMPVLAAKFLHKINFKGRIQNENAHGGYLTLKGYPKWKVATDGRIQIFNHVFFMKLQDRMKKWKPEALLYATIPLAKMPTDFYRSIRKEWELVFLGSGGTIFLRKGGAYQKIIDKWGAPHVGFPDFTKKNDFFPLIRLEEESKTEALQKQKMELDKLYSMIEKNVDE